MSIRMPFVIDSKKVKQFIELLEASRNVVILSHNNADGDAVGSVLGLYHLLQAHVPQASSMHFTLMLPNECPQCYRFLPMADTMVYNDIDTSSCTDALTRADLIIGVDFNTPSRVDALEAPLVSSPAHKVLIDHHQYPSVESFDLVFSAPDMAATCELIYWIAVSAWGADCLTLASATCLYTGIVTDTGSFSYSCEDSHLYEAAAAMTQFPIGAANIHNEVFNTYSRDRLLLLGFCITERLRIFDNEGFAYFYLSAEDIQRHHVTNDDLEGIVNYGLMMKDIEVSILVKEVGNAVRLSFRSKHGVDVQRIASHYFAGGGHIKASGATSSLNFEDTVARLEQIMHHEMHAYHSAQQQTHNA